MQILVLGPFQLATNIPRTPALNRKTRALLAYLAVTGTPHRRAALAEMFCADARDPSAALRWQFARLRQALGANALPVQETNVQIPRETFYVDAHAFEHVLGGELSKLETRVLQAAVALYRGEFLADSTFDAPEFELWTLGERARFKDLYERGLTECLERALTQNNFSDALQWAQQLVSSNPLSEEAHTRLIWLYTRTGRPDAAKRQFEYCRELLWRELAVEPTQAAQLMQDIRKGQVIVERPPAVPVLRPTGDASAVGFVGRVRELEALHAQWNAARYTPRAAFIQGDAGSGKTSLVHEFSRRVDALFLYGVCAESAQQLAYHPWVQILETHLARWDDAALKNWSPFWMEPLARLVPSFAARLAANAAPRLTAHDDELTLHSGIAEFLLRAPRTPPLLICLDDVQWADRASLRLFQFLAQRLAQLAVDGTTPPILLLAIARAEESEANSALQVLRDDLYKVAHTVALTPLAENDVRQIVSTMWHTLTPKAQTQVSAQLTQATGGNPLFVIQVLRELQGVNKLPATFPVPATVRQLIARRLRRLPESTRQVLETLAIAAAPLTLQDAQHAGARSENETIAALDAGLAGGLLVAQRNPAQYSFAHDLVRAAVMEPVSDVRTRALHRRLAALCAEHAARVSLAQRETWVERAAQHAIQGQDAHLIAQWAPLAAVRAERVGAYRDALALLEQAEHARTALEHDAHEKTRTHEPIARRLDQIRLLHLMGRWSETPGALAHVAQSLREHPDPRLDAILALRQAESLNALGELTRAFEFAQRACKQFATQRDDANAAEGALLAARTKMGLGQNRAARPLFERALQLLRTEEDARSIARALMGLGYCELELGRMDDARRNVTEALHLAEQRGDAMNCAYAALVLAFVYHRCAHLAYVREYAQRAFDLYTEIGNPPYAARAQILLATVAVVEKQWGDAQQLIDAVMETARATRDVWLEGWGAFLQGRLLFLHKDFEHAADWFEHAYALRRKTNEAQNQVTDAAWLGRVHLALGRVPRALKFTGDAVRQLEALRAQVYVWETPDIYLARAQVLAAANHPIAAKRVLARAVQELHQFAARIQDPALRRAFLRSELSLSLLQAEHSDKIPSL